MKTIELYPTQKLNDADLKAIENYSKVFGLDKDIKKVLQQEGVTLSKQSLEQEIKSGKSILGDMNALESGFYLADVNDHVTNQIKTKSIRKDFLEQQLIKAQIRAYSKEMQRDFSKITQGLISTEPTPLDYVENLFIKENRELQNELTILDEVKAKYKQTKASSYKKIIENKKESLKNYI